MPYWRVRLPLIGLLFLITGLSSWAYVELPSTPTIDSVVIVELNKAHGSGAHIGGGIILTAAHVVNGDDGISVRDRNGVKSKATVLWSSKTKDIALLKMDDAVAAAKIPAAKLFCGNVLEGDDITIAGNPFNVEFVSGYGKIAGVARKMGPVDSVYVVDVVTVMGQSGGPLFHNGKIVGVVSMVMVAPLPFGKKDSNGNQAYTSSIVGYGYAVPSSVVCELMGRSA